MSRRKKKKAKARLIDLPEDFNSIWDDVTPVDERPKPKEALTQKVVTNPPSPELRPQPEPEPKQKMELPTMDSGPYNWDLRNGAPYKIEQRGDFHIGQIYDEEPAETYICKKCGADKFIVGAGDYFTALKCTNCGWEMCIHEG